MHFLNYHMFHNLILYSGLGIILMSATYSFAFYHFTKNKAYLFYVFMQISMMLIISTKLDIINIFISNERNIMHLIDFSALFFAINGFLFMTLFLDLKSFFYKSHKIIIVLLWLISADIIYSFFDRSILVQSHLLALLSACFPVYGFLRYKQGFNPAKYFTIGWILFAIAIVVVEYLIDRESILPLLLGAVIEAICLALAIAYNIQIYKEELEESRHLLFHQSRLASMGELLNNIAHQWRQPLMQISYILINIEDAQKCNKLNKQYLNKKIYEANSRLKFMSQTINDFQNFFSPEQINIFFNISEATNRTLQMLEPTFKIYEITYSVNIKKDLTIYGYENYYMQVLLSLLINAKEAFSENKMQKNKINITIEKSSISIEDNAGGIKEEAQDKIFDSYFTTKREGAGIGLYLAQTIIKKKFQSSLYLEFSDQSKTIFKILFNKQVIVR